MNMLKWILGILICGWGGQYLLALLLPNLIMEALYARSAEHGGYNQLIVRPIADETARGVVRPSPDLLYASCVYNLQSGPLAITAPVPERYWSMQFYQMNTDNFAGITNQRDERHRVGSTVEATLIGPDESPTDYSGEVIQSPTDRGIILLRASAIGDTSQQLSALNASSCQRVVSSAR